MHNLFVTFYGKTGRKGTQNISPLRPSLPCCQLMEASVMEVRAVYVYSWRHSPNPTTMTGKMLKIIDSALRAS